MDNQLIDKIALLTQKISQNNRIVREGKEAQKEVDKLEAELKPLMQQYLQHEEKITPNATVLFKFNGKNKDLLRKLRQELEKANSKI